MSYTHFTLTERFCLQEYLKEGKSFREIAKLMGRSPSTISREVKRNFSRKKKRYNPWRATTLYIIRRKNCIRKPAIQKDTELYQLIKKCLEQYWSPELIADHCKKNGYPISFSTIYTAIKSGLFHDSKFFTFVLRK